MWRENPEVKKILRESESRAEARNHFFRYLSDWERLLFNVYAEPRMTDLHICERNNAKECIRVMKNIIRSENEQLTGTSVIKLIRKLAKDQLAREQWPEPGFFLELIALFRGIKGHSSMTGDIFKLPEEPVTASRMRSQKLNEYAGNLEMNMRSIPRGTDAALVERQQRMKARILDYFKAGESDWQAFKWQMKHIISDRQTIERLVQLNDQESDGLQAADEHGVPYQITPYYLSLFNPDGIDGTDQTVRAQVLPSRHYCEQVAMNRENQVDMDFMGEKSTSPVPGITRRYPQVLILKPIDTCPQLCVYCQRNWEVKPLEEAGISSVIMDQAIDWIRDNEHITEVLVTGGDPLMLPTDYLGRILQRLASITHVERIRIGSRIPVTLPYRIDSELVALLKQHHEPGKREICLVTHFEHPTEITPDAIAVIRMIREAGLSIYNQQVFTYYNSRRYETCALRRALKLAGVDPYYTFNTKGKAETLDFRVPIARIQQERKEEARFLPGTLRTDEPVFNVPRLGKSHLRAWQDHEVIMITPAGERVYRFYPWESRVTLVDDYLYTDTSIYDYLLRLQKEDQDPDEYKTIWYYF